LELTSNKLNKELATLREEEEADKQFSLQGLDVMRKNFDIHLRDLNFWQAMVMEDNTYVLDPVIKENVNKDSEMEAQLSTMTNILVSENKEVADLYAKSKSGSENK